MGRRPAELAQLAGREGVGSACLGGWEGSGGGMWGEQSQLQRKDVLLTYEYDCIAGQEADQEASQQQARKQASIAGQDVGQHRCVQLVQLAQLELSLAQLSPNLFPHFISLAYNTDSQLSRILLWYFQWSVGGLFNNYDNYIFHDNYIFPNHCEIDRSIIQII